jgi:hypothetical protein
VFTFGSSQPGVQSLTLTLLCILFIVVHLVTKPLRNPQSQVGPTPYPHPLPHPTPTPTPTPTPCPIPPPPPHPHPHTHTPLPYPTPAVHSHCITPMALRGTDLYSQALQTCLLFCLAAVALSGTTFADTLEKAVQTSPAAGAFPSGSLAGYMLTVFGTVVPLLAVAWAYVGGWLVSRKQGTTMWPWTT